MTLTDLCCAFANSPPNGGFIILGIDQIGSQFFIEGIKNDIELSHRFGQKIRAIPTINPPLPKIISIPNKSEVLAVFHIPYSEEGLHVPKDEQRMIFWKRTNKGKEYMTYDEIKMAFQRIPYEERKQHSSYLNEIFRKLSATSYTTRQDKTLSLEVPADYNDYLRNRATILFSSGSERPYPVRYIDIKDLDHLDWALSHLKHQDYKHIYQPWVDIDRLIKEYNHLVEESIFKITEIIKTHMNHGYPDFLEEPEQPHMNGFYLRKIFRYLFENYYYYILGDRRTDFDLQIIPYDNSNSFQTTLVESTPIGNGAFSINRIPFIQSPCKEKLDTNKLKQTLIAMCNDTELIRHFKNLDNKQKEIDNTRIQFRNQLDRLIKDIKAGYIIKGSCKLGY